MTDFTDSKFPPGAVYPPNATACDWQRTEPLLGPDELRAIFLFGIPLVSGLKDPVTKRPETMSDELIRTYIRRAVSQAEHLTGITIMPVSLVEKHPYDRPEWQSYGYLKLRNRPIQSVQSMTIHIPDGTEVFQLPLQWMDPSYFYIGQINIVAVVPGVFAAGSGAQAIQGGPNSAFFGVTGRSSWVPTYWRLEYTIGFPDGHIPTIVNELIGTIAASDILSSLGTTYATVTSKSIAIDNMSQSVGTPGPNIFLARLRDLHTKRDSLVSQIKTYFRLNLFSDNL